MQIDQDVQMITHIWHAVCIMVSCCVFQRDVTCCWEAQGRRGEGTQQVQQRSSLAVDEQYPRSAIRQEWERPHVSDKPRLAAVRFADLLDRVRTRTGPKVQVRVHVSGWTGPPSRVRVQHLG
jgi:hypothetical protein